jgi:hypothetical protein
VTPVTVDHAAIARARLDLTLPPPSYPYPIDRITAARGVTLYQQHCPSATAATSSGTA